MLVIKILIGLILYVFLQGNDSCAFVDKKKQTTGPGKSNRAKLAKKPDVKMIQKKTETDYLRHENDMRYRQFQQMQQAQQRGMHQQMQVQQKP